MTSRREFLQRGAGAAAALALPLPALAERLEAEQSDRTVSSLVDLRRPPDAVFAQTASGMQRLTRTGDAWRAGRIEVTLAPTVAISL